MATKPELADLAREMLALESDTFEINDYVDANGTLLDGSSSTSCDSSSCCSSTTSTTSTCAA